jgi:hypothetical protein
MTVQNSIGVDDLASVCEFILALSKKDGWVYTDTPVDVDQPTFELIPGLPAGNTNLRFAGRVPLLVNEQWVSAALLNSVTFAGDAAIVYRDPDTDEIATRVITERYPSDVTFGTTNSMPRASVAANWGDFVVLGDIQWKSRRLDPYSVTNTTRYPHGLWFSEPGTTDVWNPDKVFFVGQKLQQNAVLGMFPVERGLIVVTQSTIALLRGEPDDFAYEELRTGISPASVNEVTFWPYTGLVVWLDRRGRVWATNGDAVVRLDDQIKIERTGPGCILTVDDALFVSGRVDVRVFQSFGETGAWTTLNTDYGWQQAAQCRSTVIGVGADQESRGTFILDSPVNGILDTDTLHGEVDSVTVFNLADEARRGTLNGRPVRAVIATRPLPGESDRAVFWHRFGLRANGPGVLLEARSVPSADLDDRGLRHRLRADLGRRKDLTFDAHGPSLEASFVFEFEGDVTPEHVTVAAHRGRPER